MNDERAVIEMRAEREPKLVSKYVVSMGVDLISVESCGCFVNLGGWNFVFLIETERKGKMFGQTIRQQLKH